MLIFLLVLTLSLELYCQDSNNQSNQIQQQIQKRNYLLEPINVLLQINDYIFIDKALNEIKVSSKELDLFIETQDKIRLVINHPSIKSINNKDSVISVSIEFGYLKVLQNYLNDITINGSDARRYKRVMNVLAKAEEDVLALFPEERKKVKSPK
jgi:hypothetical protein